ncbi:hypothetical protein ACFO0J_12465 [Castellaniella hirudinis]|uniref:Uncharacterized protein n=1 Tax=Castellaniella hirudinis TaxID=1144617 RepID=A0ABV8S070_9BURK
MPHKNAAGDVYPLNHLHPFRFPLELERGPVTISVAFAMHCFTRGIQSEDTSGDMYQDAREKRTFCPERYQLSRLLPRLVRDLASASCRFAKSGNYVTVEAVDLNGNRRVYGVFFNVRQWKHEGGPRILLTVQSAYALSPTQHQPGTGKIRFTRLIELTLEGVKPKPPR